jgi:hypothetical protein
LDTLTKHKLYQFPVPEITLKYRGTGGYVEAKIVQLTRWRAFWHVDRVWWKFPGPFRTNCPLPADAHWRWGTYVRRLRKNPHAKCAAACTPDDVYQGAIIYRRDGVLLLEPGTPAVYAEYLATAPHNRADYAAKPLYSGVGQGLMYLAMLESHLWGFGGRVSLYSLPSALSFYKNIEFVPTGERQGCMIHCELPPESASELMRDRGLIQ